MALSFKSIRSPAVSSALPMEACRLSQIRTSDLAAHRKPPEPWRRPAANATRSAGDKVKTTARLTDHIMLLPMPIMPRQTIDVTRGPAPTRTETSRGTLLAMRPSVTLGPLAPRFSLPFRPSPRADANPESSGMRSVASGQVAPATGTTQDPSPRLSLEHLHELNPLARPAEHNDAAGWAGMFGISGFTKPIEEMTGGVTTKPISLGEGLSIPAGTKIFDANAIRSLNAPLGSMGRAPGVQFELPSGRKFVMAPDVDKQPDLHMTRVTFDGGRFFKLVGSPFFDPKNGTLTRLQRVDGADDAPQFLLRVSLTGESLTTFPARNDAISGKAAEAALRGSLR